MTDNISLFKTSDIQLASYLKCLDYEIKDISKEGNKITFIFKDTDKRKQDVLDFFNNKGLVEPNLLLKSEKDLKGILHNS